VAAGPELPRAKSIACGPRRQPETASKTPILAGKDDERFLGIDLRLEMFSLEERRRLRSHPEEIEETAAGMQRDRKTLGLSEKDQRAYQEFTTQMERAGRQIETVFVKGLIPLARLCGFHAA
jgi:hypothetical protein